jgi:hypothetical protein
VALFLASWLGALLEKVGVLALAGTLDMGLYAYFSLAAALGWLAGNVYLHRRRRLPRVVWRWILPVYLAGPPSLIFLLRAMAPAQQQELAPIMPFIALAVFLVFFLVPITLAGSWSLPPEERERPSRR